jgi:hypothetical protein
MKIDMHLQGATNINLSQVNIKNFDGLFYAREEFIFGSSYIFIVVC